jgi:hypothetical protein
MNNNIDFLIQKFISDDNTPHNETINQYLNLENGVKTWLKNTKEEFSSINQLVKLPYRYYLSPPLILGEEVEGTINMIYQFYIDDNKERHKEIQNCLKLNVANNSFHKIYLLNERIYSNEELGIESEKICQINIGKRLSYKDIFDIVEEKNIEGYIVACNSDIFFDASVLDIKKTPISKEKRILSSLRYEYNKTPLKNCKLFGPRSDSQDSWIFHSNQNIPKNLRHIFDISLGIPGCDNRLLYLFNLLGYYCHNEPKLIKSYHYQLTRKRNYDQNTAKIPAPWIAILPKLDDSDIMDQNHPFNIIDENINFYNYIKEKIDKNENFVIPRIAGVENNFAHIGAVVNQQKKMEPHEQDYLNKAAAPMKVVAGIKITNLESVLLYSHLYLDAFHRCEMYTDWEPWSEYYMHIQQSHPFITGNFQNKRVLCSVLDIFNYVQTPTPWTHALKGKRLLIISPFMESFKSQLPHLEKIYGRDFFPDCTFVFIKPPQTQGEQPSEEFNIEFDKFINELENIKDDFDVALAACGGYGNLVCARIHAMDKSAIYVGGALQLFFGVYGERWVKDRPDIISIFKNEHWIRPSEKERPEGFKKVEGGSYW